MRGMEVPLTGLVVDNIYRRAMSTSTKLGINGDNSQVLPYKGQVISDCA
jgi:hypothetical protein